MGMISHRPIEEQVSYWCDELDEQKDSGTDNALVYNSLAFELGKLFVLLKVAAADRDTERKLKKLERKMAIMESGTNKTTAAEVVEEDSAYLDAVQAARIADELRDKVEVYYSISYQRAWLLNRLPMAEKGV